MKNARFGIVTLLALALAVLLAACASPTPTPTATPTKAPPAPTATPTPLPTPTPTPAPKKVTLYVTVSPNKVIEIDAETNAVVRTLEVEIPGGGRWAYNDDNNYNDGANLWLTTRASNGAANDIGVLALNLDTMKVSGWFKTGSGNFNPFIGKATKDGILPVANRDLGTVSTVDTKGMKLLNTFDVPLALDATGKPLFKKDLPASETVGGGSVVCDMDIAAGPDGKELAYYPTQGSELVIAIDPYTGQFVKAVSIAKGSKGNMLSTHPTNGTVWPQENGTNSQSVFGPTALNFLGRVPTIKIPVVNSFSPDGKLSYVNGSDTAVTVVDTATYQVVATVEVGANATRTAAHPNGKVIYVQVDKENSVAVIDTATWKVTKRIDIGVTPASLHIGAK